MSEYVCVCVCVMIIIIIIIIIYAKQTTLLHSNVLLDWNDVRIITNQLIHFFHHLFPLFVHPSFYTYIFLHLPLYDYAIIVGNNGECLYIETYYACTL